MECFCVSGCDKGKVGLKKLKNMKVRNIQSCTKAILIRIIKNMILIITYPFVPLHHEKMLFEVVQNMEYPSQLRQSMINCLRMCRFRIMEKRLLRSLIIGIVVGDDTKTMITEYVVKEGSAVGDSDRSDDNLSDSISDEGGGWRMLQGKPEGSVTGRINKDRRSGNARGIVGRAEHDWHHFSKSMVIKQRQSVARKE